MTRVCAYKHVQFLLECKTHRPNAQPLLVSTTCPFLLDRFLNQAYNTGSCVGTVPVGSLPLANNVKTHSTSI